MFYYIRYYKLRCRRCGFHWATVLNPALPHLGEEVVQCSSCQGTIFTGWKEWPQFTTEEQGKFSWSGWQGLAFLLGFGVVVDFLKGELDPLFLLIWIGFIVLSAGIILLQRAIRILFSKRRFRLRESRPEITNLEGSRAQPSSEADGSSKPLVTTSPKEWEQILEAARRRSQDGQG